MSDQQNPQILRRWLLCVLLTAFALRAAAVWQWRDELTTDRDGYLAIAANLRHGNGFSSDGAHPTAFRPPLYPVFLAAITAGGGEWGVAFAQVMLGVGTVWLTFLIGRNLGMQRGALAGAGLVAIDPLLLRYTPQLMTETLATFLVGFLVWVMTRSDDKAVRKAGLVGLVFGLSALCRPTIWAFGMLAGMVWIVASRRFGQDRKREVVNGLVVIAVCLLVVSPWVVRNQLAFGRPVVLTTHGGYTLLLGNNPVFYDEVVRRPWGTVWPQESLLRWQESLEAEMRTDSPPPASELERDRWHRQRAMDTIRDDPSGFAAACRLRFRRFWNVVPTAEGGELPGAIRWAVAGFYSLMTVGFLVGLIRLFRRHRTDWQSVLPKGGHWWPLVAVIVSFTAVHLVYWTNTRMRAPLIPVVALICIQGLVPWSAVILHRFRFFTSVGGAADRRAKQ